MTYSQNPYPIPKKFHPAFRELQSEFVKQSLPQKKLDRNLLICYWNIRHFIQFQNDSDWKQSPRLPTSRYDEIKNPHKTCRDPFAMNFIAQIIAQFDIVMITEVQGNGKVVKELKNILGINWGLLIQDVAEEKHGEERLVYLYDLRKVQPSGLVCEISLPENKQRQFARPPYVVGFRSGQFPFTLVALHIKWNFGRKYRLEEIKLIAERLKQWQKAKDHWAPNLIAIGDFQLFYNEKINYKKNPMYKAFTSTGLYIPPPLRNISVIPYAPPTISGGLAWFNKKRNTNIPKLEYEAAGNFNFIEVLENTRFKDFDYSKVKLANEVDNLWNHLPKELLQKKAYAMGKYISDKFPLWVSFNVKENKFS